jgi:hypothetical protein
MFCSLGQWFASGALTLLWSPEGRNRIIPLYLQHLAGVLAEGNDKGLLHQIVARNTLAGIVPGLPLANPFPSAIFCFLICEMGSKAFAGTEYTATSIVLGLELHEC